MSTYNITIKEWHANILKKADYLYEGERFISAKGVFDGFILNRLPKAEIIYKWHNLLTKYISDDNSNVFFVRKYESTKKNNGEWDNRRGAVVSFDENNVEIVYSSNNLAHEIYLMARDGFVPNYDDFVDAINSRALPITSGTEVEKKIRLYGGSNKRCEGYLAHLFDVNGDYYINKKPFSVENRRLYPKGIEMNWLNSPDKIYHIKEYTLSSDEISIIKAHMLRFLDPINYFVMPKSKEQTVNGNTLTVNYGEDDKFLQYVKYAFSNLFKTTFDDFCSVALTNYSAELVNDYSVDFSYCNEDSCHKNFIKELSDVLGIDSAVLNTYESTYKVMKKCDYECSNCNKCTYLEACFNSLLRDQNHPPTVAFEQLYKSEQEYISTVVLA